MSAGQPIPLPQRHNGAESLPALSTTAEVGTGSSAKQTPPAPTPCQCWGVGEFETSKSPMGLALSASPSPAPLQLRQRPWQEVAPPPPLSPLHPFLVLEVPRVLLAQVVLVDCPHCGIPTRYSVEQDSARLRCSGAWAGWPQIPTGTCSTHAALGSLVRGHGPHGSGGVGLPSPPKAAWPRRVAGPAQARQCSSLSPCKRAWPWSARDPLCISQPSPRRRAARPRGRQRGQPALEPPWLR